MPSETRPAVYDGPLRQQAIPRAAAAICRDDNCPWKYVDVAPTTPREQAEKHVRATGHAVRIYVETHEDMELADG